MKLITLAIVLILSTSAMASPSGGGEGGDKVFARMMAASQAAMDKYAATHK